LISVGPIFGPQGLGPNPAAIEGQGGIVIRPPSKAFLQNLSTRISQYRQQRADEIRQRKASQPSADYSVQVFGELIVKATSAHENMMRLSRTSDASVQEKSQ